MASSIMFTPFIVTAVVLLRFSTASTTNNARLDNLEVVVDGTNVTLTLWNGDNGKGVIIEFIPAILLFIGCVTRPPTSRGEARNLGIEV